jgi:hypothetical protein
MHSKIQLLFTLQAVNQPVQLFHRAKLNAQLAHLLKLAEAFGNLLTTWWQFD